MHAGLIGFGRGRFFLKFFIFRLALLACAFWIWMLVSAIKNPGLGDGERICWVLTIILLPFIGSLLYLLIAYSKAKAAKPA